jgi:CBS domain-containing protein
MDVEGDLGGGGDMRHLRAKDIMTTPVITVRAADSLPDVIRVMRRHGFSGAPVVDEFGLMVGIVSEGDLLEKEAGPGGLPELAYVARRYRSDPTEAYARGTTVEEIMSRQVVTATQETTVREVAMLMVRNGVNRVPIVRGEDLVGIVSRADILTLFAASPASLLAEARHVISEDLRMDPNALEILVVNGVIQVRGEVSSRGEARLIATFLGMIDGVSAVDVSALSTAEVAAG